LFKNAISKIELNKFTSAYKAVTAAAEKLYKRVAEYLKNKIKSSKDGRNHQFAETQTAQA
jgi:hypothetical protein